MNRENLLKEMKDSVGTKDPVEFFSKMTDVFNLLFDHLESLEANIHRLKIQSALSIKWDPKVASDLIDKQIQVLRKNKDVFSTEIHSLKQAYTENKITQSYDQFCEFWLEVLGYHPFLDYNK